MFSETRCCWHHVKIGLVNRLWTNKKLRHTNTPVLNETVRAGQTLKSPSWKLLLHLPMQCNGQLLLLLPILFRREIDRMDLIMIRADSFPWCLPACLARLLCFFKLTWLAVACHCQGPRSLEKMQFWQLFLLLLLSCSLMLLMRNWHSTKCNITIFYSLLLHDCQTQSPNGFLSWATFPVKSYVRWLYSLYYVRVVRLGFAPPAGLWYLIHVGESFSLYLMLSWMWTTTFNCSKSFPLGIPRIVLWSKQGLGSIPTPYPAFLPQKATTLQPCIPPQSSAAEETEQWIPPLP